MGGKAAGIGPFGPPEIPVPAHGPAANQIVGLVLHGFIHRIPVEHGLAQLGPAAGHPFGGSLRVRLIELVQLHVRHHQRGEIQLEQAVVGVAKGVVQIPGDAIGFSFIGAVKIILVLVGVVDGAGELLEQSHIDQVVHIDHLLQLFRLRMALGPVEGSHIVPHFLPDALGPQFGPDHLQLIEPFQALLLLQLVKVLILNHGSLAVFVQPVAALEIQQLPVDVGAQQVYTHVFVVQIQLHELADSPCRVKLPGGAHLIPQIVCHLVPHAGHVGGQVQKNPVRIRAKAQQILGVRVAVFVQQIQPVGLFVRKIAGVAPPVPFHTGAHHLLAQVALRPEHPDAAVVVFHWQAAHGVTHHVPVAGGAHPHLAIDGNHRHAAAVYIQLFPLLTIAHIHRLRAAAGDGLGAILLPQPVRQIDAAPLGTERTGGLALQRLGQAIGPQLPIIGKLHPVPVQCAFVGGQRGGLGNALDLALPGQPGPEQLAGLLPATERQKPGQSAQTADDQDPFDCFLQEIAPFPVRQCRIISGGGVRRKFWRDTPPEPSGRKLCGIAVYSRHSCFHFTMPPEGCKVNTAQFQMVERAEKFL